MRTRPPRCRQKVPPPIACTSKDKPRSALQGPLQVRYVHIGSLTSRFEKSILSAVDGDVSDVQEGRRGPWMGAASFGGHTGGRVTSWRPTAVPSISGGQDGDLLGGVDVVLHHAQVDAAGSVLRAHGDSKNRHPAVSKKRRAEPLRRSPRQPRSILAMAV